jgi:hypothetical protein
MPEVKTQKDKINDYLMNAVLILYLNPYKGAR